MLVLNPLHPALVHFPIALLPVALACDLLGRATGRASLAHAAWWTLLFATLSTPLAVATGWIWLADFDDGPAHRPMVVHQWIGTALSPVLIALAVWRYRYHTRARRPSWPLLATLAFVTLLVLAQGHIGGAMTSGGGQSLSPPTSAASAASSQPVGNADDGWQDSIRWSEVQR